MFMRVLLLTSGFAACTGVAVYNPPNAGVMLDALEKALNNIINSPHLSKEMMGKAKKVSADVETTVTYLESAEGKKLSDKARAVKVTAAIKELQALQEDFQLSAVSSKEELLKKLKAKQEELVKDQKMLKVITLEKALAEKKLSLQKLIDMKNNEKNAKAQKEAEKEAAAQQEMVANVLNVAKTLKDVKPANQKPADAEKLKSAQKFLEGRIHTVSDSIAKLDAEDKKHQDELNATVNQKMPVKDASDPLAKSQGILKMLMKKEHRNYEKARAGLQNELNELKQAVTSINKGDAAGLTKVMSHMQGEMKAKSKKFLY